MNELNENPPSLDDARAWCREFVSQHSENFEVASRWLLDDATRDAYFALYAFARGADDRADNQIGIDPRSAALDALKEWQDQLDAIYDPDRSPSHPAFVALEPISHEHTIERELFVRMIDAFRHDQTATRYDTWEDLLQYTAGSADPVGRWVLRVHDYRSPALDRWSDAICTALQLVNFLQDVREDLEKRDRIYLPREDLERFGVSEEMLTTAPAPDPLRDLIHFEAERAERLFAIGRSLIANVDPALKRQLILFHGGGRLALHALRRAKYDVTSARVEAGKPARIALLSRALRGRPL